jgi:hypothetical protein
MKEYYRELKRGCIARKDSGLSFAIALKFKPQGRWEVELF